MKLLLVGIAFALSGQGATPTVSAPRDDSVLSNYVKPQQMIVVQDQRRLNVVCMGEGSPVVFLQSGAGDSAAIWYKVQSQIAQKTRVCSYDRAGLGFSDPATVPVDPDNVTKDLERLLVAMKIRGPIVLVGHSLGGLYVEHFVSRHPKDVAGVVLVDPTGLDDFRYVRDMLSTWPEEQTRLRTNYLNRMANYKRCSDLAEAKRLEQSPPPECIPQGIGDPTLDRVHRDQWITSTSWPAFLSEMTSFYPENHPMGVDSKTTSQVRSRSMSLGNKPLTLLLTPGLSPPGERGERLRASSRSTAEKLVTASTQGQLIQVASGHYVHLQHPEIVVDAVDQVVDKIRLSAGH